MNLRTHIPRAIALLLLGLAPAAIGQTDTNGDIVLEADAPVTPVPGLPAEGEKDPASGVPLYGLMRLLAGTMQGQRVIAVGSEYRSGEELDATEYARARTLVEKLQVISAVESPPPGRTIRSLPELIPFRVGNAYAIAPEMREGVNVDFRSLGALEATARGALLASAILSIDPKTLPSLGRPEGIPVSSLPRETAALVAHAFRPSLQVMRETPTVHFDDNGIERQANTLEDVARISEPIDWSRARLRVYLRFGEASLRASDGFAFLGNERQWGLTVHEVRDGQRPWWGAGVDLPIFRTEPNTYKPSDLEGRRLPQPFGLSGVWKAGDVVAQLARVTGLNLKIWRIYEDRPVFIGTPDVTAGEVLDALRLGFTGAWRRMDDTYLLSYDRMPVQAIQLSALESARAITRQVRADQAKRTTNPAWISIIRNLPFSPDDLMALTSDQRERLLTVATARTEPPENPNWIPFTDLTPDQQSYLRKRAETSTIYSPPTGPGERPTERPITEADLHSAYLQPNGGLLVSVEVPDHGWLNVPRDWDGLSVNTWHLREIAARTLDEKDRPDILDDAPPEIRKMLEDPKPLALPSAVRGVIVPALGPERLNVLADEMKRHGLNTLFYPAFIGGYATFESGVFPRHPSLRGEDGWAAAVTAMKPKGIKVVGYLNTLAWQNAGDTSHWLAKYPQWMDVDALGRSRLAWAAAVPEAEDRLNPFGVTLANFVRPSEPLVEARLRALVAEFAGKEDAAGIAFAEWNLGETSFMLDSSEFSPPALGFAMPERMAGLRRNNEDPADVFEHNDYAPASLTGIYRPDRTDEKPPADHHAALVSRLLADARERRKDWTTYLLNNIGDRDRPSAQAPEAPKADVTVASMFATMEGRTGSGNGISFPIARRNFFAMLADSQDMVGAERIPQKLLDLPSLGAFHLILATEDGRAKQTFPIALLDFRNAPEKITDTMRSLELAP